MHTLNLAVMRRKQPSPRSAYLRVPDVHTFVKRAAGQMSTVWTEGHAVDWLLVFGQCVDADSSLHVPETDSGVKRCAVGGRQWRHH